MRIAVLGVGLIGGSIGRAARERLDGAEVVGWDPDPRDRSTRAVELGAIDRAAASLARGLRGRRGGLLRGPGRGARRAGRARRSPPAAPRTRRHRRRLDQARARRRARRRRALHRRPPAGRRRDRRASSNARADLFEGARWYLTPTERSSGVLYDRLQRIVAGLGARPQAIEAEAHDRLMATVSHLPHVLANVLVERGRGGADRDSERMPEVGPSFRDATRVAGSNPAIWGDIFASNREAVADAIEAVGAPPARGRRADPRRRPRGGRRLARAAPARTAAACSRPSAAAGRLRELRVVVANRPGTVAELALALGEAGVNIEDMALHPAPDMTSGAVSLWVAGAEQARARGRPDRGPRPLGHASSTGELSAWPTRFDPAGPLRGTLRPPADKSISHRAALIAAMGEGETLDRGLPRRRRHALDAGRGRGARRRRRGRRTASPARSAIGGVGLQGAVSRRRSTSATPAPCCACCRAGSPGSRAAPGSSTATTRSGAARSTGSPSRCAAMGARLACREDRLPPLAIEGAPLTRDRLRAAGRQRPGQVLPALRRPARRGRDAGGRAACRAATTASGCWRAAGAEVEPRRRRRRRSAAPSGSRPAGSSSPPTSPPPPSSSSRRCSSPGSEVTPDRASASTRPAPACSTILERMGAEIEVEVEGERGGEPTGTMRRPRRAAARDRGRRRRGAAGDRRAAAGRRSPPASPRGRRRSATRPSCAARSRTGSRPSPRR